MDGEEQASQTNGDEIPKGPCRSGVFHLALAHHLEQKL